MRGFSLIELMISVAISLVIVGALSALLLNVSRTNAEMAKSNSQIENGRFAIQTLESELVHAGFWGGYVPEFDDLNWPHVPNDVPSVVPDPCLPYTPANWTADYINSLLGIGIQTSEDAPGTCVLDGRRAGTDVLVVRHAATCLPGEAGCEADINGKLYFQSSLCMNGVSGLARAGSGALNVILAAPSSETNTSAISGAYVGMNLRIVSGAGAGQVRKVTAYNGFTQTATVAPDFAPAPDQTSRYTIAEGILSTSDFTLRGRGADCSAAPVAPKRKFVSYIYYIRDYASVAGDGIPTLVRAAFDSAAAPALSYQAPEALVEGIEDMAIELGVDSMVTRCNLNTAVNYADKVTRIDPATCALGTAARNMLPTNRGDGTADTYVRCTTAVPCTPFQLANAVTARLYLLVRNTEPTLNYTDTKTYCMGASNADGSCPDGSQVAARNDGYKRHLFTTSVRLTTISARREAP